MPRARLCDGCERITECKETRSYCNAINELFSVYSDSKKQIAQKFIDDHRSWLSIVDAEYSDEYEKIADHVIDAIEELHFIKEMEIKVGYVNSYEAKTSKGCIVYADCRKVNAIYQCFVPYDFIITIYEPNAMELSVNQLKVLLWHEMRHIGINERTLATTYRLMEHEVDDFHSILDRFGTRWNEPGTQIEDIIGSVV